MGTGSALRERIKDNSKTRTANHKCPLLLEHRMLELNVMKAASTRTYSGRNTKSGPNYPVKSPRWTSATGKLDGNVPPLTHGSRPEPIPTSRLALPSLIYPHGRAGCPPSCGQPQHAPAPSAQCPQPLSCVRRWLEPARPS